MDVSILLICSAIFIIVCVFFFFHLKNEKKKSQHLNSQFEFLEKNMQDIAVLLLSKSEELSNKQGLKFEDLSKEIRIAQDQSNSKINNGFERLQSENIQIQSGINEKVSDIKKSFTEYMQKVEEILNKYNIDTNQTSLETNRIKEDINSSLQNILREIKAPLDLD